MQLDGLVHPSFGFLSRRPACFKMLLYVPGAKSSDGWPAMVTRPAFVACLN